MVPMTEDSGRRLHPHVSDRHFSGLEAAAGNHRAQRVQDMVFAFERHIWWKCATARFHHIARQLAGEISGSAWRSLRRFLAQGQRCACQSLRWKRRGSDHAARALQHAASRQARRG